MCNQYDNLANRLAHYETTGPEIWRQTDGKITHLVCTAGTGGTITGTAMYLKEKNPDIQVWAIDVYGSLLTKYFRTGEVDMNEVHPYISEGFGEDFVPKNYDMSVIDHFEQVTDKAWRNNGEKIGEGRRNILRLQCRKLHAGINAIKR